jgi:GNAT superfamily N-acetyltransferase
VTSAGGSSEATYHEPARTYASAWWLGGILVLGFLIDALLGGATAHLLGWLGAIVIVVGADILVTRAARAARSITVTPTELHVGEESITRVSIVGIGTDVDARVLGRRPGEQLPRGTAGLMLHLADGESVVVPTRRPVALRAALAVGEAAPEIRPADDHELDDLLDLERRSDTLFTVAGIGPLPEPASAHPPIREARAVLVAGRPALGFARIDEIDGQAHLEQLYVLPSQMRRGLGTSLIEASCAWAVEQGYSAMTVCTFSNIAWNEPFFAKRGFEPIGKLTPGLAELRDWERSLGLDALGERVVMRRDLRR